MFVFNFYIWFTKLKFVVEIFFHGLVLGIAGSAGLMLARLFEKELCQ